METGPFAWLTRGTSWRLFAVVSGLLVATSAWLGNAGDALVTPAAPHGIVSYELAGDLAGAAGILESWSPAARSHAILIQGVDTLYLLVYPAWLSLAAALLASSLGARASRVGAFVSWAVWAAAPLDLLENHALLEQLFHGPASHWARLAWWCAVPKFALVLFAAGYVLLASAAWTLRRLRGARPA